MSRTLSMLGLLFMTALQAAPGLPSEVKVGTSAILDYEFDWGRDGVDCPACNGGAGNSRLVYADSNGNLWVAALDPASGNFIPANGRGTLVDTRVAGPGRVGNGPEWALSGRGSEIVYTRWIDGMPQTEPNVNLGFARQQNGAWTSGPDAGTQNRQNPGASLDASDAVPREAYTNSDRSALYWRDVAPGAVENTVPLSYAAGTSIPRRWVKGTSDLVLTAPAAPDANGVIHSQVFLFHSATGQIEQLTFDAVDKTDAFMWSAPEFGGNTVFFTLSGGTRIDVYRQQTEVGGTSAWTLANSITMPPDTPYVGSPEPFVHNGASWVFFWASTDPSSTSAPSRIGLTGIDPAFPSLRMLTSLNNPTRSRRDPEYFVTANGPYIYYNRYVPRGPKGGVRNEGVFRVDTGLGPRQP